MAGKFDKLICGVCTLVELGCIIGLAGIGFKRNNDCYKAEMKLVDAELDLGLTKIDNICKEQEIQELKAQIEELQKDEG